MAKDALPMEIDLSEPFDIQQALADLGYVRDGLIGDYRWFNTRHQRIGTERKSIPNLASSLANGELAEQLRKLVEDTDVANLLVEGPFDTDASGRLFRSYWVAIDGKRRFVREPLGWSLHHLLPAVYVMAQFLGVIPIFSPSIDWTPKVLRWMYSIDQDTYHGSLYSVRKRELFVPSLSAVALAAALGPQKADLLLREFSTLEGVLRATPDSIRRVKGIGPSTLKQLNRLLTEPYSVHTPEVESVNGS